MLTGVTALEAAFRQQSVAPLLRPLHGEGRGKQNHTGPDGHANLPVAFPCMPHKGLHRIQALPLAAYKGHQQAQRC